MAVVNDTPKVKGWGVRVEWACKACGRQMRTTPSQVRICCSRSCASRLRPPPQVRAAPRINCPTCGKEFSSRMCGGARMKYCCRSCADQRSKAETQGRQARRLLVAAEAMALKRIAKYVSKPSKWRTQCEKCGAQFVKERTKGRPKGKCGRCGDAMVKRNRRAQKVRRRAIERGAQADRFDPLTVLQRDGWKCRMCGIDTPKNLRGTLEHNAPELDHIVPLAKGGAHTLGNTQCLCRSCNQFKSDSLMHEVNQRLAA